MESLTILDWALLATAALLVGFAKTAIGGVATISVAVFAAVLPARQSTGALLVLLLVGDLVAVSAYRRDVDWRLLGRLIVPVALGVVVGAVFLSRVDDTTMRRTIGVILLALCLVQVGRWWMARRRGQPRAGVASNRLVGGGYGALAGFTTMVANAGGPVMSLYLLSADVSMLRFLGTSAFFFFGVNVFKLPFSIGLGLITPSSLAMCAALVPVVLAGTWIGRVCIRRIDQGIFERLVLVFTVASAVNLLR